MISSSDFASRLCAILIQQGFMLEDSRGHEVLHETARKLFEEVTKEVRK